MLTHAVPKHTLWSTAKHSVHCLKTPWLCLEEEKRTVGILQRMCHRKLCFQQKPCYKHTSCVLINCLFCYPTSWEAASVLLESVHRQKQVCLLHGRHALHILPSIHTDQDLFIVAIVGMRWFVWAAWKSKPASNLRLSPTSAQVAISNTVCLSSASTQHFISISSLILLAPHSQREHKLSCVSETIRKIVLFCSSFVWHYLVCDASFMQQKHAWCV